VPADFISDRRLQLNDIYLVANRVEGVESGAYLYDKEAHALEMLKAGEFSEKAAYLSLEQELGGDASVTLFFIADLDRVLRAMGNRGYRAVQMEAAIIGGRVYLAAYALKRGATGLTFYDDEVTDFFAPNAPAEGCIFEIAIGVAGRRPMY
jgi:SagB-type dehydrogenase family enzyme